MSDATLKHIYTGKVRELYEVAHDRLLMVASDRTWKEIHDAFTHSQLTATGIRCRRRILRT